MKKYLIALLMVFAFSFAMPQSVDAQTYTYRSTSFAYRMVDSYGDWTSWSSWEDSNVKITINFDTDVVNIYSSSHQRYKITKYIRNYTDSSGGTQIEYEFIDQDGDRGNMRLRIESNGNSQIYIDFSNIMWVYPDN